jgi:hypothetical protein
MDTEAVVCSAQSSPLHDKLVPVAFYLLHHHCYILCPHSSRDLQLRVWVLVAFDVDAWAWARLSTPYSFRVDMIEWCLLAVKMKQK